jgi:hypothetical protein
MSMPGYRLHDPTLPSAALTAVDLSRMKQAVRLQVTLWSQPHVIEGDT